MSSPSSGGPSFGKNLASSIRPKPADAPVQKRTGSKIFDIGYRLDQWARTAQDWVAIKGGGLLGAILLTGGIPAAYLFLIFGGGLLGFLAGGAFLLVWFFLGYYVYPKKLGPLGSLATPVGIFGMLALSTLIYTYGETGKAIRVEYLVCYLVGAVGLIAVNLISVRSHKDDFKLKDGSILLWVIVGSALLLAVVGAYALAEEGRFMAHPESSCILYWRDTGQCVGADSAGYYRRGENTVTLAASAVLLLISLAMAALAFVFFFSASSLAWLLTKLRR